jgi:hypothetical protein
MKAKAIDYSIWRRRVSLGMLTGMLLCFSVQAASAQGSGAQALVGAWAIQVTLRDCSTGAALGPPFRSLVTFHQGGTLSESPASTAFAAGQRSDGHGLWTHDGGNRFIQKMIALILFETAPNLPVSPGFFAGWQTVTHTIEVTGDTLSSSGTNGFFRTDRSLYRSGCSTATGERFK